MRTLGTLAVAAALLVGPVPAHAASSDALARQMRAVVAAGAPGAIVLARDGSRTLRLAAGVSDRAHRTPMRVGDRFRVGSVTKTFVATVVLQLVGEGRLALDDTVERWVPGLVPGGEAITVRELLNHTSGLFDYIDDGDSTVVKPFLAGHLSFVWSPRELVGIAVKHPAHFPPGARWSYSNTGYVVLGLVVEAVTGDSLANELQRRIFAPLALRRTSFDSSPRIRGAHAHGYFHLPKRPLEDVTALSPSLGWAAGAVVSTAGDLARFYRALLGGHVLSGELLQQMETTVSMGIPGEAYGLGLWRTASGGLAPNFRLGCLDAAWGHDGDFPGYVTWAFNSQDGQRQVVAMVNDDALSRRAQMAVARMVRTGLCGS